MIQTGSVGLGTSGRGISVGLFLSNATSPSQLQGRSWTAGGSGGYVLTGNADYSWSTSGGKTIWSNQIGVGGPGVGVEAHGGVSYSTVRTYNFG